MIIALPPCLADTLHAYDAPALVVDSGACRNAEPTGPAHLTYPLPYPGVDGLVGGITRVAAMRAAGATLIDCPWSGPHGYQGDVSYCVATTWPFRLRWESQLRSDSARYAWQPERFASWIVAQSQLKPVLRTERIPAVFALDSSHVLLINSEGVDGQYMRAVQRIVTIRRDVEPWTIFVSKPVVLDEHPQYANGHGFAGECAVTRLHSRRLLLVCGADDSQTGLLKDRIENLYLRTSDDDAHTWSRKIRIADIDTLTHSAGSLGAVGRGLKVPSGNNMFVLGGGPHTGRIVIGAQAFSALGSSQGVIYSDDQGATWRFGRFTRFVGGEGSATLSEPALSLGDDGQLLMTIRVDGFNRSLQRYLAISRDGGKTFDGVGYLTIGTWPSCQISAIRVSLHGTRVGGITLVSGPTFPNPVARRRFRVMVSYDDLHSFPLSYAPFDDRHYVGYSSLAMLDSDTVVLGYETGTALNHDESIGIAVFNFARIFARDEGK